MQLTALSLAGFIGARSMNCDGPGAPAPCPLTIRFAPPPGAGDENDGRARKDAFVVSRHKVDAGTAHGDYEIHRPVGDPVFQKLQKRSFRFRLLEARHVH